MLKLGKTTLVAALVALCLQTNALAADTASYTITGSANNWTLDFTFTNGIGSNNLDIYFVGVDIPDGSFVSAPANWTNFGGYMGYNITPFNYGASIPDMIQNGESVSGFKFLSTASNAPTSINWFAYHYDWVNGGAQGNPVEFGTATVSAVPEPETYAMLLAGLGVMGAVARRRKAKQA